MIIQGINAFLPLRKNNKKKHKQLKIFIIIFFKKCFKLHNLMKNMMKNISKAKS